MILSGFAPCENNINDIHVVEAYVLSSHPAIQNKNKKSLPSEDLPQTHERFDIYKRIKSITESWELFCKPSNTIKDLIEILRFLAPNTPYIPDPYVPPHSLLTQEEQHQEQEDFLDQVEEEEEEEVEVIEQTTSVAPFPVITDQPTTTLNKRKQVAHPPGSKKQAVGEDNPIAPSAPPLVSNSSSSSGLQIRRGAASPTQAADIRAVLTTTRNTNHQGPQGTSSSAPPLSTTKTTNTTKGTSKAKSGAGDTQKLNAKAQDPVDLAGDSEEEEEGLDLTARVKGFAAISNGLDLEIRRHRLVSSGGARQVCHTCPTAGLLAKDKEKFRCTTICEGCSNPISGDMIFVCIDCSMEHAFEVCREFLFRQACDNTGTPLFAVKKKQASGSACVQPMLTPNKDFDYDNEEDLETDLMALMGRGSTAMGPGGKTLYNDKAKAPVETRQIWRKMIPSFLATTIHRPTLPCPPQLHPALWILSFKKSMEAGAPIMALLTPGGWQNSSTLKQKFPLPQCVIMSSTAQLAQKPVIQESNALHRGPCLSSRRPTAELLASTTSQLLPKTNTETTVPL